MPGGYKNINGNDGVKFNEGNKAAVKWTEEGALKLATDLIKWMKDADENIFFDEFIFLVADSEDYDGKLYPDLIAYLGKKYSSFFELY